MLTWRPFWCNENNILLHMNQMLLNFSSRLQADRVFAAACKITHITAWTVRRHIQRPCYFYSFHTNECCSSAASRIYAFIVFEWVFMNLLPITNVWMWTLNSHLYEYNWDHQLRYQILEQLCMCYNFIAFNSNVVRVVLLNIFLLSYQIIKLSFAHRIFIILQFHVNACA